MLACSMKQLKLVSIENMIKLKLINVLRKNKIEITWPQLVSLNDSEV